MQIMLVSKSAKLWIKPFRAPTGTYGVVIAKRLERRTMPANASFAATKLLMGCSLNAAIIPFSRGITSLSLGSSSSCRTASGSHLLQNTPQRIALLNIARNPFASLQGQIRCDSTKRKRVSCVARGRQDVNVNSSSTNQVLTH